MLVEHGLRNAVVVRHVPQDAQHRLVDHHVSHERVVHLHERGNERLLQCQLAALLVRANHLQHLQHRCHVVGILVQILHGEQQHRHHAVARHQLDLLRVLQERQVAQTQRQHNGVDVLRKTQHALQRRVHALLFLEVLETHLLVQQVAARLQTVQHQVLVAREVVHRTQHVHEDAAVHHHLPLLLQVRVQRQNACGVLLHEFRLRKRLLAVHRNLRQLELVQRAQLTTAQIRDRRHHAQHVSQNLRLLAVQLAQPAEKLHRARLHVVHRHASATQHQIRGRQHGRKHLLVLPVVIQNVRAALQHVVRTAHIRRILHQVRQQTERRLHVAKVLLALLQTVLQHRRRLTRHLQRALRIRLHQLVQNLH